MRLPLKQIGLVLLAVAAIESRAWAEDIDKVGITIKDHRFEPAELHVPAGKPALLAIHNADATVEEFESSSLVLEKVVPAGATVTVRLRPLEAGRYSFFGDYHSNTAQGVVVVDGSAHP